jgi:hypothetical protein
MVIPRPAGPFGAGGEQRDRVLVLLHHVLIGMCDQILPRISGIGIIVAAALPAVKNQPASTAGISGRSSSPAATWPEPYRNQLCGLPRGKPLADV